MNLFDSENGQFKSPGPGKVVSARTLLNIIFKRKYVIISVFVSIVATVLIGVLLMTPVYQASSKIIIEKDVDNEKSLLFRMNLNRVSERYDWIKSEAEIIKSDPVAIKVVENLRLKQTEFKSADPGDLNVLLKAFKSKLKIANTKDSNVLDISYESSDPSLAVSIVNTLVSAYINYRSHLFNESGDYQFFNNQIQVAEQKLCEQEKRQVQFKQAEEIISPEIQNDILFAKIADYEKALTNVRTKRIGKEAMIKVIKQKILNGDKTNIPVTESSNSLSREKYITKLRGELLDLELKRDQLLQKYNPEYEEIANLEQTIANTRRLIEKEIEEILELEDTSIRALQAEEEVLQNTIDDLNNQIKKFAQKEYELTQLSRGIEDNREVYSMLVKQREEVRISQAKLEQGVKIKVISPALLPSHPIRPRKELSVLIAVFLGLVSSFGLAFSLEYFDHTFNSPEEVESHLGLHVWGSIKSLKIKPVV